MTLLDTESSLYGKVVRITDEYLGPAADRFIARQIQGHLRKDPEKLEKQDLKNLIDWISLAMSLLSEDEALIRKYITSLKRLTNGNGG